MTIITLPSLNDWVSNLAGILPLSALIEFTDPPSTLHSYQLCGRGLLWNWLITPAGARLLLSTEDQTTYCCLDRPGVVPTLYCMDGRWGDSYPCSSPNTIRTCIASASRADILADYKVSLTGRPQCLELIRVRHTSSPESASSSVLSGKGALPDKIARYGHRWVLISAIGWIAWTGVLAASLLSGLHVAGTYLLVLLFTGITVRYSHGHKTRKLLDRTASQYSRLVVAADSMNGAEWNAFIGGHKAVDSLLNKPLYQVSPNPHQGLLRMALRVLIATQWGLTAVASAFQDWNALVIFLWISVCALVSSYVYSDKSAVKDWSRNNEIDMEKLLLKFTTRRSMLSALVTLNPDRKNTKWIDPILAPSDDRSKWEAALHAYLDTGKEVDKTPNEPYWWPFILEGVEIARQVEPWVRKH